MYDRLNMREHTILTDAYHRVTWVLQESSRIREEEPERVVDLLTFHLILIGCLKTVSLLLNN